MTFNFVKILYSFSGGFRGSLNDTDGADGSVRGPGVAFYMGFGTPLGEVHSITPQIHISTSVKDYSVNLGGLPVLSQNLDSPG